MQVRQALDEYQYATLDHSPMTRRWYVQKLEAFAQWCHAQQLDDLDSVKPIEVRRFIGELRERDSQRTGRPLSSYTLHGYAQVIKGFLAWCAKEELISERVAKRIEMPRVEIKVIETFNEEHIKRLFAACTHELTPTLIARNKAILAVLLDTGIRAGELCGLTLDRTHLSPNDAYLKVFGKGRKQREVGLGKEAAPLVHRYVSRYRRATNQELRTFVNRHGRPLTPDGLDQMLYRLRDRAHVTGVRCSAHTFRHTYAVRYLEAGGDIYKLSRLLGHTSVGVTENYLRAFSARAARQGMSVFDELKRRA
jgi:integrase/recombinase XerD